MKRYNAQKEGIQYYLLNEEVCFLLAEADITVEDWSFMGYHLSRYNDVGDYIFGNCRFIPYHENYREKKITETSRAASRAQAKKPTSELARVLALVQAAMADRDDGQSDAVTRAFLQRHLVPERISR